MLLGVNICVRVVAKIVLGFHILRVLGFNMVELRVIKDHKGFSTIRSKVVTRFQEFFNCQRADLYMFLPAVYVPNCIYMVLMDVYESN